MVAARPFSDAAADAPLPETVVRACNRGEVIAYEDARTTPVSIPKPLAVVNQRNLCYAGG